jgi:hypothetical protein
MSVNNIQEAIDNLKKNNYPSPIPLPALYGKNSYLVGNAIIENPTAEDFGCKFSIGFAFQQTPKQNAITQSLAQQAETDSISGLRAAFADQSAIMQHPQESFVSLALQISALIDFGPEGESADKLLTLYDGPLISFILPPVNTEGMSEDTVLFLETGRSLLNGRTTTVVNSCLNALDAFAGLMEQTAAVNATSYMDMDSDNLAAPASTLAQQQRVVLDKIVTRMKYITVPAKKFEELEIVDLTLRDLVERLTEMFNTDAQPIIVEVLSAIRDMTSFLDYEDERETETAA